MSATQQRRAIRRAFGPEAAELIREQQELLTGHHLAIADLIKSRDGLTKALSVVQVTLDAERQTKPKTLWARLRWLVRG